MAAALTDEYNVVNASLVQLGVSKGLLHWLEGAAEQIRIQFLKAGTRDACVEVDTLVKGVYFNVSLRRSGKGALCALTRGAETTHCTLVVCNVLLVLALELLNCNIIRHRLININNLPIPICKLKN